MKSLPFISKITNEAPNGDRAVSDSDVREIIKTVWSNGVSLVSPDGSDLQVVADNGMSVKVLKGGCIILGAIGSQDKEMTIKISPAHSSLKRMDRIVARLDLSEPIRSIEIYLKEGTPSTTPVAPNLVQASNYYEIALADIRVKAGVKEIKNVDILDQRQNPEVCGFVQPAFPTNFDISAITDRYTELLSSALSGDVASKLNEKIESFRNNIILIDDITKCLIYASKTDTFQHYPYQVTIQLKTKSCTPFHFPIVKTKDKRIFAQAVENRNGKIVMYCTTDELDIIKEHIESIILTKQM